MDHSREGGALEESSDASVRVFLVDDHEVVRRGVAEVLEEDPVISVVGEAGSVAEALARVPAVRPDVTVVDMRLPDGDGAEVCRKLRERVPGLRCLVLTSFPDEDAVAAAVAAGASGYVLKAQADSDLMAAVRAVEKGEPFLTPAAQRALIKDVLGEGEVRSDELTPREQEVVKLVAEAHTNKEIADILHLSEKTVENHRSNAMKKLGMRDRVELVRYAIRRGLIEP